MAVEIQNYLGEVVLASISEEQLVELQGAGEHNYFAHDPNEENDLVQRWKVAVEEGHDVSNFRIFKYIS